LEDVELTSTFADVADELESEPRELSMKAVS
jgi:hypothetical protein